ncbi:MAG TPA: HD domain-containing phosphohydrolase [Abditibacteriaceae bacterium]
MKIDKTHLRQARILIVDDEELNVLLLERYLQRFGYSNFRSVLDSRDVLHEYSEYQPDLILLDLMMPHVDGFEVMAQLESVVPQDVNLPILVLTANVAPAIKERALAGGAKDFLHKPFEASELLLRMDNLLETHFLHLQMQNQNHVLEQKVRERTQELEHAQIEVLHRLARAAELRDDDTGQHTQRVGQSAALMARALGLSEQEVNCVRQAAPLHDVGKIGVSDLILLKPGKLTPQEFEIIKSHTELGAAILSGGNSNLVQVAETIALTHHERWDGGGYPRGLSGEEIPLFGRIVAVADVFDALTHARPYKQAWSAQTALAEIEQQSGKQFDPKVVEVFRAIVLSGALRDAANDSSTHAQDSIPWDKWYATHSQAVA